MELPTKLHRVRTDDFTVVVKNLIDIVDQLVRAAGHADDKVVEINFRNAFNAGSSNEGAGSPVDPRGKSQIRKLGVRAPEWPVEFRIQAEIANSKCFHRGGTERLSHS